MKKTLLIGLVLAIAALGVWFTLQEPETPEMPNGSNGTSTPSANPDVPQGLIDTYNEMANEKRDLIVISDPAPGEEITSPLTVSGQARGYWFFEASFPLVLTDWDGRIIAEGYATADGDWMTEEFVPFTGTIEFEPLGNDIYSHRGTLIFEKSNPSGLPENADALEMPVIIE